MTDKRPWTRFALTIFHVISRLYKRSFCGASNQLEEVSEYHRDKSDTMLVANARSNFCGLLCGIKSSITTKLQNVRVAVNDLAEVTCTRMWWQDWSIECKKRHSLLKCSQHRSPCALLPLEIFDKILKRPTEQEILHTEDVLDSI